MGLWPSIPRGFRVRLERALPEWFWIWLRQLREVELDRRWTAGRMLLAAHPELAAERSQAEALRSAECRVYSQGGQDGIVAFLLGRIGATGRTFVEFGIGDGSECNTANLSLTFGWSGLLLEAESGLVERARSFYGPRTRDRVRIVEARVTPENIDPLLRGHGVEGELGVLSLDIDGNDLWVWRGITAIEPRLVVIEYNASFGPERSVTVPYKDGFDRYAEHVSGFYHGASLAALAQVGREKGYSLAGCDSNGTDAFFVRTDLLGDGLREVAPAEAFFPLWERAHLSLDEQFAQIAGLELVDVS